MRAERRRYLGIDMAGDSGKVGAAWLEEERTDPTEGGDRRGALAVHVSDAGFSGDAGLQRLIDLGVGAEQVAVDSPFGFPGPTLALLNGQGLDIQHNTDRYRYRVTDLAMRARLDFLRLGASYVTTPLRIEFIRRTMQLLERAGEDIPTARRGEGCYLETHARLAVVELLSQCSRGLNPYASQRLVADYKRSGSKHRAGAREARRAVLYHLGNEIRDRVGKGVFRLDGWRRIADDVQAFEALFGAFAAFAKALGAAQSYPGRSMLAPHVADVEGCVFVPNWVALFAKLHQRLTAPS